MRVRAFESLHALGKAELGGNRETPIMLGIAAGLLSVFPPFAGWIDALPHWAKTGAQLSLLGAALFGAVAITRSALRQKDAEFVLPSTCQIPSSDPIAHKPGTGGLLFGYTTDDGSPLYISDKELCNNGIIIGQTGMGKSVLGKSLMYQQIQRGGGVLFIDGKLDQANIEDMYRFAVMCGRGQDFKVINPGNPSVSNTYNPILYGDADEIASRIISLIPDTNSSAGADHYKANSVLALVVLISALQECSPDQAAQLMGKTDANNKTEFSGLAFNFLDLAMLMISEAALNDLFRQVQSAAPQSMARKNLSVLLESYAKELGPSDPVPDRDGTLRLDLRKVKDMLGGIGARLHSFASSKFGQVTNTYSPDVKMYEAVTQGQIVYVSLPTMGKEAEAMALAKIIVGDLRTTISWLQMNEMDRPKIPFLAFLDEMSSYATESFSVMFEQCRSARVSLFPAIQTTSGLSKISEDFKERILSNTETKIYFKLSSQESATDASDFIGMTRRISESETATQGISASAQALSVGPNKNLSDSSGSASGEREVEEPLVHPDQIKSLGLGECLILRAPRLWNVIPPLIEITPQMKSVIGPLTIQRSRNKTKEGRTFNIEKRIDNMIAMAQKRRTERNVKPKKEKPKEETVRPPQDDLFEAKPDIPKPDGEGVFVDEPFLVGPPNTTPPPQKNEQQQK